MMKINHIVLPPPENEKKFICVEKTDFESFLKTPINLDGPMQEIVSARSYDIPKSRIATHNRSHSQTSRINNFKTKTATPRMTLSSKQERAFETKQRIHIEDTRKKLLKVNQYLDRLTMYETDIFNKRYSPQRPVQFCSRSIDHRVTEQIASSIPKRPPALDSFFD